MADEYGITPEGKKLPYYAVKLTPEEYERIKGKRLHIYEALGKQTFEIRDERGPTGEVMFYVIFK